MEEEIRNTKYFYAKDGRIIRNLEELAEEIQYFDDETFYHHVSHERNDFANWIRDALEIKELADLVATKTNKQDILSLLELVKDGKPLPKLEEKPAEEIVEDKSVEEKAVEKPPEEEGEKSENNAYPF